MDEFLTPDGLGELIFFYTGAAYVRPCSRGVCLVELPDKPHLEDVLPEGDCTVDIVVRRVKA